jgi:hypothetical protein
VHCTRCDDEVPAAPESAIERHAWLLWFAHRLDANPAATWAYLVLGVIAANFGAWVTGVGLLYAPLDVTIATMCLSTWRHYHQAPWCLYCRGGGGGGGDHERIPDPEPVGRGAR